MPRFLLLLLLLLAYGTSFAALIEDESTEQHIRISVCEAGLSRKWWDHSAMANAASRRLMVSVLGRLADVGPDLIRTRMPDRGP